MITRHVMSYIDQSIMSIDAFQFFLRLIIIPRKCFSSLQSVNSTNKENKEKSDYFVKRL